MSVIISNSAIKVIIFPQHSYETTAKVESDTLKFVNLSASERLLVKILMDVQQK